MVVQLLLPLLLQQLLQLMLMLLLLRLLLWRLLLLLQQLLLPVLLLLPRLGVQDGLAHVGRRANLLCQRRVAAAGRRQPRRDATVAPVWYRATSIGRHPGCARRGSRHQRGRGSSPGGTGASPAVAEIGRAHV